MINRNFGSWFVKEEVEKRNNKRAFLCVCSCGNESIVSGDNLRSGISTKCKSCSSKIKGGLHGTHKRSKDPLYAIWRSIKLRCFVSNYANYKNYGGRGMTMCDRWKNSFEAFLEDMGERPNSNSWIDRINNEDGYRPKNCRWVSPTISQRNKRNNIFIEFNGEKRTISDWANLLGICTSTLYWRHQVGWSDKEIISTPIKNKLMRSSA